jgi:N-terminal domain of galactosyltransferase
MKKVSFCITCKNRFYQISKTLPANLEGNKSHKDSIEFILVDFNSDDGLKEWIFANFNQALSEGYLKYFYTDALPKWHGSIAKNTSHYYASGEFLVNLDGDNYVGKDGGKYVQNLLALAGENLLLHQFDGNWNAGNYGRIGMHRKYFKLVGGYDESLEPMGHEDMDLINRLVEIGLSYKRCGHENYSMAIRNSREESIQYSASSLSWRSMEIRNARHSRTNVRSGNVIANNGLFGLRNVSTYWQGNLIPISELAITK